MRVWSVLIVLLDCCYVLWSLSLTGLPIIMTRYNWHRWRGDRSIPLRLQWNFTLSRGLFGQQLLYVDARRRYYFPNYVKWVYAVWWLMMGRAHTLTRSIVANLFETKCVCVSIKSAPKTIFAINVHNIPRFKSCSVPGLCIPTCWIGYSNSTIYGPVRVL